MSAAVGAFSVMVSSICTMLNLKRLRDNANISQSRNEEVDNTKYVPREILQQANENTNVQSDRPIITKKGDYEIRTHSCGCVFETKVKGGYGYSNHWCDKHAPRHSFDMPNIPRQTTEEKEGQP